MHPERKYDSGASKRRKKQKLEEDAQLQKGALDKFVMKEPQPNSQNQTPDANIADVHGGFLFTLDKLRSLDDKSLLAACVNLEDALKSGEHKDIHGLELSCKLLFL